MRHKHLGLRSPSQGDHWNYLGMARVDDRGTTKSCWNFEPTNTTGGPSSYTELTSKEIGCRDCATSHTRGSIGGPTTIGSCKEAQVF
jgi:hypothetical protein